MIGGEIVMRNKILALALVAVVLATHLTPIAAGLFEVGGHGG